MKIEYLKDYPQFIDACAAWAYGRWGVQSKTGSLKKILDKLAYEKQAWEGKPISWPKKGIVERMINFPFKHPKLTMFGSGLGLGYWLANKKNTINNYYQEGVESDSQPYNYQ